ncbi:MAG: CBS domain-containing protein [Nitrososphaerota archaeon]
MSLEEIVAAFPEFCSYVSVSSRQPALVAGALLASQGASHVVVADHGQSEEQYIVEGVITGREILGLLAKNHEVWRHVMRVTSGEISRPVPSLDRRESLAALFGLMSEFGVGFALVNDRRPGMLDLLTVLRYSAAKRPLWSFLRSYRAADVCSGPEVLSIESDQTVLESIHLMLNKGVRRLVVEDRHAILSDRSVVKFLFGSIQNMELTRDSPERLFNLPVGELDEFLLHPAVVASGDDLEIVLDRLLASEAKCCLLEDGGGIITPWDLTVKLFLRLSAETRPM